MKVSDLIYDILNEEAGQLNYYAFDWDDNIMDMPTKIWVYKGDKEEGRTTAEFAKERLKLKDLGYVINPETSFRDFREGADSKFLEDIKTAPAGPAWGDFIESLESGAIIAIITARGHNPNTLKKGVEWVIDNKIDKEKFTKSINDFFEKTGKPKNLSFEDAKKDYLNRCRFYPVSHPSIAKGKDGVSDPSTLKTKSFEDFAKYIEKMGARVQKAFGEKKVLIGFSDDDEKNVEVMSNFVKKNKEKTFKNMKTTIKDTGKKEVEKEVI